MEQTLCLVVRNIAAVYLLPCRRRCYHYRITRRATLVIGVETYSFDKALVH